jgi:hypothetical protein
LALVNKKDVFNCIEANSVVKVDQLVDKRNLAWAINPSNKAAQKSVGHKPGRHEKCGDPVPECK